MVILSFYFQNASIISIYASILYAGFLWFFLNSRKRWIRIIAFALCLFSIAIIVVLQNRTSFLALIAVSIYILFPVLKRKYPRARLALIGITFFSFSLLFLVFFLKTDSSLGRWFILKNSFSLWSENWLIGVGFGKYNPHYNHIQAEYFSNNSLLSKEAMLANDGYFVFNEFIQIGIELGLAGFVFLLVLVSLILRTCIRKMDTFQGWSGAVLIAIFIACLFSYPLHDFLLLTITIVLSAYIISGSFLLLRNLSIIALPVVLVFVINFYLKKQQLSKLNELASEGYKSKTLSLCAKLSDKMVKDYGFTIFYLNLLYETGRFQDAVKWFEEFHKYHCNQRSHLTVAMCYEESGDFTLAEHHYLLNLYITPHLLKSRDYLMDFYDRRGNIEKAIFWANEILSYPSKIQNVNSERIKKKAHNYLDKLEKKL